MGMTTNGGGGGRGRTADIDLANGPIQWRLEDKRCILFKQDSSSLFCPLAFAVLFPRERLVLVPLLRSRMEICLGSMVDDLYGSSSHLFPDRHGPFDVVDAQADGLE
jgi:hypothetical protein